MRGPRKSNEQGEGRCSLLRAAMGATFSTNRTLKDLLQRDEQERAIFVMSAPLRVRAEKGDGPERRMVVHLMQVPIHSIDSGHILLPASF